MSTSIVEVPTEAVELTRNELCNRIERCDLDLPLLPHAAGQILAMTHDGSADAASLANLVHRDQSLAGHVLRIANSAALGGRAPIVSLQHAVARLGSNLLAGLALAASMRNGIFRIRNYEIETRQLWRHSLASALYAKEIARLRRRNPETPFLCGLLHNIGKPVALKTAVDFLRRHSLEVDRGDLLLLVEELHSRAGALLAAKWDLPRPVLESIVYVGSERGAPSFLEDARTALLADRLASFAVTPGSYDEVTVRQHPVYGELNLYPDQVEALLNQAAAFAAGAEAMEL